MACTVADESSMQQALLLAQQALRRAAPNPGVGCVLMKEGRLIGRGATQALGEDHAEIQALKDCAAQQQSAEGATAYVTLEPCSHQGRTPPCIDALIRHRVRRVVVALLDPYFEVAGRGVEGLAAAGIEVDVGCMAAQAEWVHRGYLSRIRRQRPWVLLKVAASLDGKTALLNGMSQWITGEAARAEVQVLRAWQCALMTGSGTVRADNPRLTIRDYPIVQAPWRVVVDGSLQTSPQSLIYQGERTVLATAGGKTEAYQAQGVECLSVPDAEGHVDLAALLQLLAARGVNHLMVEAGARLNGALMKAGLVDEIVLYLAPIFLGDSARGLFNWPVLSELTQQYRVEIKEISQVGADLRLNLLV